MNRKGQVLVIFIIFLSVLFVLTTFLFDLYNYNYNKIKLNNITKHIIKSKCEEKYIIDNLNSNYKEVYYNFYYKDNKLNVKVKKPSKFMLIDSKINLHYICYYDNEDIVIERVK